MKVATAHLGLGAILPQIVFAGQAKQWEQQREIFEKRAATNITNNINSGNVNSNNINSGNILNLDPTIINNFNAGVINFYSNAPDCYYAKLCDSCSIVKVAKGNSTYVDQPCPVCPVETLRCPGYTTLKTIPHGTNGTSGVCDYQPPVCISCHTAPAPPPPSMTTVAVHCPTCSVSSEVITCPATAASSIASIASVSGASVAKSAASQANAITVTAASAATAPASSTIVNVPCSSCPAGSQAVTVAQVTPEAASSPGSPASPGSPGSPASPGNVSTPSGTGPAASHFTGSADSTVTSVLSIIVGLMASTIMFL